MSQNNGLNTNLKLDRVISTQPELGPSVPDGGYGWIVFIAGLLLQIGIPSILSSYGIFMLFTRIESSALSKEPKLWDVALLPTPIVYMAFWTLADPWSRTIVATSTWPRLVATTGIFLSCAGLLIQWVAMRDMLGVITYMLAGAISGIGSSLAMTQTEILLSQYFRVKLLAVNNLLSCAYSLGFIIVPITLGLMSIKRGILHTLLIYQAVILQCVIIILVYKKPLYLKAARRRYELLQNASEDDEMIFAKDETELTQNKPTQQEGTSTSSQSVPNVPKVTDNSQSARQERKPSNLLTETFSAEFARDLGREISVGGEPRSLFSEIEIDNVNTYAFDNNVATADDNVITVPPPDRIVATTFRDELGFLWKFSFYKSLFFIISLKYSTLMFWILFPTYLYVEMDQLKMQQTTFLVGVMSFGSLFISALSSYLPVYGKNRQIVTAVFCFLGSAGYFILSDAGTEGWLLFGALHITSSVTALQILYPTLIKFMLGADSEKAHTLLHTLAGISILLLLTRDISYKNCFRITSLLQFLSSLILCYNILFTYLKKLFTR